MAQLIKLGKFLVEIEGSRLAFYDTIGNPQGQPQDLAQQSQLTLPDGSQMPVEQFTELLAGDIDVLADFQTAAGEPSEGSSPVADSGGGRFAVFEDSQGIGGLNSVGGLQQTSLDYGNVPERAARRDQSGDAGFTQPNTPHSEHVAREPDPLMAPEISATGGKVVYQTTVIAGEQNPLGDEKVGDYLIKGGAEGKTIDPAMVNGVDNSNLTLAQSAEVKLGFVSEGAGYKSMVGVYHFDSDGNIVPGSMQLVWLDASQVKQGIVGGALAKDFLGNSQPSEISLGTVPSDTKLGFFIVANGAADKNNQKLIASVAHDGEADDYAADLAAINQHVSFATDGNGNGQILIDGKPLAGNVYFTHDKALNTDGVATDIEHTLSGVSTPADGKLYVGFEDLAGGGDRDFQDVVFSVDMGSYNINKLTQNVTQPNVDLSDADGTHLSSAIITTRDFQPGDSLNLPDNPMFDATVTHDGNDMTIAIAAKSGAETIEAFEDFINHVYFATTSTDTGDRIISYQVTDTDGRQSDISTVAVEFSYAAPDIDAGAGASSGTDDVLHLNIQQIGQYHDLGDGYDTVQLGHGNMSFGHNDARMLDNIEVIDAKGAGHNDIAISIDDVIDMTDGNHHLTILGKKGDSLTLTGDGWTATDHGPDFTTYTFNDGVHQAVVEVSNQMTQTIV